ncbi:PREDICTED: alkane hydroxylase MAH1-like [Tarenaya hassleriana]|uniref:alkane hydroxylase MAH1-like n=1 Tax=Tarenaya hassleriana TaxID=28532 RepID=UPI00053C5164|nr:PREDICTED: alkane hydroxylase MAH1-like [Tarenaya hassleriana]
MAFIGLPEISIAFICFLIFHFLTNKKPHESFPRNWPFLGMLPGLIAAVPRIYDWNAELLEYSNMTFISKGIWFAGMDVLVTADPDNIRHIMSSNFRNYPKGPEFKEMFDALGDGIFNVDSELWEDLRKSFQAVLHHQGFQRFTFRTSMDRIKKGLVPFLDHAARAKMVVDIQDVLERYSFDAMLISCTGYDPGTLSIEMPEVEFYRAFDDFEEAIIYRHFKPRILWKLQNWLGLGIEKKMTRARATFDRICAEHISAKRKEMVSSGQHHSFGPETCADVLTCFMNMDRTKYKLLNPNDDEFLRDTMLTFMTAGRGTGSIIARFLWFLSKHPRVLTKIRQEMKEKLPPRTRSGDDDDGLPFDPMELKKLVYLHAALSESLRLYPPVPFERKSPVEPDVLPSGHRVAANSKIVFPIYALGRMKRVWGEDALEFKPERWISETGRLKQEPPSKFFVFNAGPRTCLGKDMAYTQFKTLLVEILQNYDIHVVEGQRADCIISTVLRVKDGLKVTVTKRSPA